MNFSTASRTYQLLTRIFDVRNVTEPFLPSAAEKKALPLRDPQQPFPRATPESQGISSDHIRRFLEELNRAYRQGTPLLFCILHINPTAAINTRRPSTPVDSSAAPETRR